MLFDTCDLLQQLLYFDVYKTLKYNFAMNEVIIITTGSDLND